ncbi:MAG: leucine-rich repeat domain-containing protein [Acidaminococcaceae bacterium]|nr:leucine-rich repeat domain-containing protein [Acidaminococcaceae bacterium]
MGIEQLVARLISLVLLLTAGYNPSIIDELTSTELALKDVAIGVFSGDFDRSAFEFRDNAWFAGSVLVFYPPENKNTSYSIPEGTTAIMPMAFHYNDYIQQITCPASLVYIGSEAFCQTHLSGIDLNHVKMIGGSAFEGTGLSVVNLPDQIVYIGPFAFYGVRIKKNTHVVLPPTLLYIGSDIVVSGNSSYDTFEPIYEVISGSYAYDWVLENGYDYVVIDQRD